MNNKKLVVLMEIAIMAGLSFVLDKLSISMPQGGSFSFGMLPIVLVAYRHGILSGITTGFIVGLISAMMGSHLYHWLQVLLDYGLASTVIGFAGVTRGKLREALAQKNKKSVSFYVGLGVLFGATLSFITHVMSGAIFFAEYAGTQNPWIYSIIYNATYMVPSTIITIIIGSLLFATSPRLITNTTT